MLIARGPLTVCVTRSWRGCRNLGWFEFDVSNGSFATASSRLQDQPCPLYIRKRPILISGSHAATCYLRQSFKRQARQTAPSRPSGDACQYSCCHVRLRSDGAPRRSGAKAHIRTFRIPAKMRLFEYDRPPPRGGRPEGPTSRCAFSGSLRSSH
jgi:hypothetical protein